ncbi:MAG TPA: hypothetical protein VN833_13005, partial [Candidatus Acidoferrales bacterium]|nr:hypothetical protein [Candidatus Acidoferrales bacterium]
FQQPDPLDDSQACSHGLFRVIFIRVGVTEVNKDAIADTARDKSAESRHDLGNGLLVSADQLMKVFNIKVHRERR